MSNFKLNLPTDIPWERICVTEDMIDRIVCDERLPAKWQTSMAVFKYRPEDEYQLFPLYNITYLKVTATITGYQPLDQEIQGEIDWDGVDVSTIAGLTDLLNSYNPCHGAILQVVVGPHGNNPDLQLKDYPFFTDFEPKKRELYELATDTKEKSSRSIESLNITKSAGNTQSMEVLDVDMGGGGFGAQASYAGTGGGFNYTAPNGQWGTKRLNADESLESRSADVGQEKRESYSFSTQISQMYHLLDSYHLGTNRAVFFVQPRPHVLEEPSGFVRGPRPVDGIQEFFLIVAQLKEQEDFCVSLRLDTSHLTKKPIMEHEKRSVTSGVTSVAIPVPKFSEDDLIAIGFAPDGKTNLYQACLPWPADGTCWNVPYLKWKIEKSATATISAPTGFLIDNYVDVRNEVSHGWTDVFIAGDDRSATITVKAQGLIYQETGEATCFDCPNWVDGYYGSALRQISLNCISEEPTKQVGEEDILMITTRGLCCCSSDQILIHNTEFVVSFKAVPKNLSFSRYFDQGERAQSKTLSAFDMKQKEHIHPEGACKECAEKTGLVSPPYTDPGHTIRLANELSQFIKTETIKSLNDPSVKLKKFADTEFFAQQLENTLLRSEKGRKILYKQISAEDLPEEALPQLEEYFKKDVREITRKDLLSLRAETLAKMGIRPEQVQKIKLALLGVKFRPDRPEKGNDASQTAS